MNECPIFVSVIIPVYNRENTIQKAVESVLNQTYPHFEIIVVDDCSTDTSAKVVLSMNDERIRLISHDQNRGAAAARNTGIKHAKGNWIAFLDSDDVWKPDKLEKQIDVIKQIEDGPPPIVYTSFHRFKSGKKEYIPMKDGRQKEGNILHALLLGNFISTQTLLLHKKYLEQVDFFDEDLPRFQDWELCIRLSLHYPFLWIDEPLVDVYYSNVSISSDQKKMIEAYAMIISKHGTLFKEVGLKYFSRLLFSYGHNLCLYGDMNKGRKALLQALRANIFSVKNILALFMSIFGKRFYQTVYYLYRIYKKIS